MIHRCSTYVLAHSLTLEFVPAYFPLAFLRSFRCWYRLNSANETCDAFTLIEILSRGSICDFSTRTLEPSFLDPKPQNWNKVLGLNIKVWWEFEWLIREERLFVCVCTHIAFDLGDCHGSYIILALHGSNMFHAILVGMMMITKTLGFRWDSHISHKKTKLGK